MCVHHVFQQTAFTNQKDFGKEAREAKWAAEQRTLHGLQSAEMASMFSQRGTFRDINLMAEEARRRAEISRSVPLINYTTILHGNWLNFKLTEYYALGGRCLVWHRFSLFILPWSFCREHDLLVWLSCMIHFKVLFLVILFSLCRLRELRTLKGRVESFAKLRGLDIDSNINPHYTV